MLPTIDIQCPYCGESIDIVIDDSAGDQRYIEDCQVCCRPMVIDVTIDDDGRPRVGAAAKNDTG